MFDLRTKFLGKFAAAIVANPELLPLPTDEVMGFALELAIAAEQVVASYDPLLAEQLRKDQQTADEIRRQLAPTEDPQPQPQEPTP